MCLDGSLVICNDSNSETLTPRFALNCMMAVLAAVFTNLKFDTMSEMEELDAIQSKFKTLKQGRKAD